MALAPRAMRDAKGPARVEQGRCSERVTDKCDEAGYASPAARSALLDRPAAQTGESARATPPRSRRSRRRARARTAAATRVRRGRRPDRAGQLLAGRVYLRAGAHGASRRGRTIMAQGSHERAGAGSGRPAGASPGAKRLRFCLLRIGPRAVGRGPGGSLGGPWRRKSQVRSISPFRVPNSRGSWPRGHPVMA